MAVQEIDCRVLTAVLLPIQVKRACDAVDRRLCHAIVSFEEAAHIITVSSVPFCPAVPRWEAAHLIKSAGVPCLRNQLHIAKHRIKRKALQQWRLAHRGTVLIAP